MLAASCCFSRSVASLVLVTPLMNLTNRSPYRSGGIAEICDSVFAMPLMKCSMRLISEYYSVLALKQNKEYSRLTCVRQSIIPR